jgi:hypothetical protein
VLLFLSLYRSKENKKNLLNLGTQIEEKYRHIYQDTAVSVFLKEREKHDVNKIYGEDYCEER